MDYTLTQYKKYEAKIRLKGFILGLTPNHMIIEKLQAAGFTNVFADGAGDIRRVTGVWKGGTTTLNAKAMGLPSGVTITDVIEL